MEAEIYIKARKVFVDAPIENTEQCPYCQGKGETHFLRYFYVSLEEAIYKCANSRCLFPFDHFKFKNLKDKTTYYYEEVKNGSNDIMFKVSLDGQKPSKNPLETKLFSESQRNPDIESYDADLFDFLNDDNVAAQPNKPQTAENDFLSFLDEIPETAPTTNDILDANDVDSFINGLLEGATSDSQAEPQQMENTQSDLKLSKCLEHIQKVKGRKKANDEQPKSTFLQKVSKTKSNPSTTTKKRDVNTAIESIIKSSKNLRPTEFLNQLKSLDSNKTNSNLIRQLVKIKQENIQTASNDVEVKVEPVAASSNDAMSIVKKAQPAKTAVRKRAIKKEKVNEESLTQEEKPKKKRAPAKRPKKTIKNETATITETNKIEQVDGSKSQTFPEEMKCSIDIGALSMDNIYYNPMSNPTITTKLSTENESQANVPVPANETDKKQTKRPRKKKEDVKPPKVKKIKENAPKRRNIKKEIKSWIEAPNPLTPMADRAYLSETISEMKIEPVSPNEMSAALTGIQKIELIEDSQDETLIEVTMTAPSDPSSDDGGETALIGFSTTQLTVANDSINEFMNMQSYKSSSDGSPIITKRSYKRKKPDSSKIPRQRKISDSSAIEILSSQSSVSAIEPRKKPKRIARSKTITKIPSIAIETPKPVQTIKIEQIDSGSTANAMNVLHPVTVIKMEKSKMDTSIYYRPKKFKQKKEKCVTIHDLIDDWNDSGSESQRRRFPERMSLDSDSFSIQSKETLGESDLESIISLSSSNTCGDAKTEHSAECASPP